MFFTKHVVLISCLQSHTIHQGLNLAIFKDFAQTPQKCQYARIMSSGLCTVSVTVNFISEKLTRDFETSMAKPILFPPILHGRKL